MPHKEAGGYKLLLLLPGSHQPRSPSIGQKLFVVEKESSPFQIGRPKLLKRKPPASSQKALKEASLDPFRLFRMNLKLHYSFFKVIESQSIIICLDAKLQKSSLFQMFQGQFGQIKPQKFDLRFSVLCHL